MKTILPIALIALVLGAAAPAASASTGVQAGELSLDRDGYWRDERVRVWVDGFHDRIWIEPCYEYRYQPCGTRYRVCVREGRWDRRWVAGHWEYRTRRVWVDRGHRRGDRDGWGRRGGRGGHETRGRRGGRAPA
ncbi:MAG: hypothetical protein R3F20_11980 [Planctomycetota bacterium]